MNKQIVFVTSNKGKLQTAQTYFDKDVEIVYYNFNIKELEVNDIDYIAEYKVKEAYEKVKKACISLLMIIGLMEFMKTPKELLNATLNTLSSYHPIFQHTPICHFGDSLKV